jgi:7,8-dihydropterin-6-yl-methyl-4-(beta-D-ribofuranosyl)aminobenzene 5'-phosphate synthase
MKITILYDNTVFQSGLKPDWGFSCLVETHNRSILFDTGSNGSILLENMKKLDIDPLSIDEVFISHSLRGIRNAKEIIYVDEPLKLHKNIFSTGELDHIEQSMAVKTDKGLVLVVGCSHPKMESILKAASQFGKVYAIIGGLHGFNEFELFKDLEVICPTHCTQHIAEIKSLYPEKYIEGGAGKIIEI